MRYCVEAIYSFAFQIIVVEGAVPKASSIATSDGHSTDGTLSILKRIKKDHDPEKKVTVVTAEQEGHPDGFWTGEKDEMSRVFAKRASGDYIWQVDIDEFYHPEDLAMIRRMLSEKPSINGISFCWVNFWGGFEYVVDGWAYRNIMRNIGGSRRVFKWGGGYQYTSHRPPTVIDRDGRDISTFNWVGHKQSSELGLYCYHYGMVFPKQANQKSAYYPNLWLHCKEMRSWYEETFLHLRHPFKVLHGSNLPSWLRYFHGTHPPAVKKLIVDLRKGIIQTEMRETTEIEKLVESKKYGICVFLLHVLYHVYSPGARFVKALSGALRKPVHSLMERFRQVAETPLKNLPDVPEFFLNYRRLLRHPELSRKPGGWLYKGSFYPDYLTVGGASHAIFHVALRYCRGKGVDIGAGYWPFPKATPVDCERGPGLSHSISEFRDGSLDFVFSSHCLEHFRHWEHVLTEWTAKLRSGGIVFLYLPHRECAIWRPGSPFIGDGHKWIPTPTRVKAALKELGLELIDFDDGPDSMYSFFVCAKKKVISG